MRDEIEIHISELQESHCFSFSFNDFAHLMSNHSNHFLKHSICFILFNRTDTSNVTPYQCYSMYAYAFLHIPYMQIWTDAQNHYPFEDAKRFVFRLVMEIDPFQLFNADLDKTDFRVIEIKVNPH